MRPRPRPAPPSHAPRTAPPWYGSEPDPAQVDPAVLGALLRPARLAAARRSRRALRPLDPARSRRGGTSLLVPESRAFPDSEDLLGEALTALARSAAPSAREVLVGLAVPSDEIRWWRDVPPGPLGCGVLDRRRNNCASAARQMLLAGALAARGAGRLLRRPAPPPGAARPWRASWSAPAPGGRGLTAFVPVRQPAAPSPYASTTPCTPPARPSTTSGPPAAWRPSTPPSRPGSAAS